MRKYVPITPCIKGAVSYFSQTTQRHINVNTSALKQNWETKLGEELDNETWEERIESVHKCSIDSGHNLIEFKTVHRLFYSKDKLHKIFPDVAPLCKRCKEADGSLTHSL